MENEKGKGKFGLEAKCAEVFVEGADGDASLVFHACCILGCRTFVGFLDCVNQSRLQRTRVLGSRRIGVGFGCSRLGLRWMSVEGVGGRTKPIDWGMARDRF